MCGRSTYTTHVGKSQPLQNLAREFELLPIPFQRLFGPCTMVCMYWFFLRIAFLNVLPSSRPDILALCACKYLSGKYVGLSAARLLSHCVMMLTAALAQQDAGSGACPMFECFVCLVRSLIKQGLQDYAFFLRTIG
jgi:hypothetical protein